MTEDRRQIVKDKIKKLISVGYTNAKLASTLGVSVTTVSQWRTHGGIQKLDNFSALMAIPENDDNKPLISIPQSTAPPKFGEDVYGQLREIMGHIKQLTSQVKECQSDIAVLRDRNNERFTDGEKKRIALEQWIETIATQIAELSNRIPRQKKSA